jgi:hypothetical protein
MKSRQFAKFLSVLVILSFCLKADAKIYLISIPVTGSYSMGQSKPFTINLGEPLVQINQVRLICQGTVTAGLDYWMNPVSDKFYGYFPSPNAMMASGPSVGAATYPLPQSFSADVIFTPLSGATWDFLLDGQASGTINLSVIYTIPEFPLRSPPSGYLSSAQILIDAVPLEIPVITGDFDNTGDVDFVDFAILASAWMTQVGDTNYNSDCDISIPPDNVIDSLDLAEFFNHWLEGN